MADQHDRSAVSRRRACQKRERGRTMTTNECGGVNLWPVGSYRDGWFHVSVQIVGSANEHERVYNFGTGRYSTRGEAISNGFANYGTDDFNVGQVIADKLVWFGWMDEPHPLRDRRDAAVALGVLCGYSPGSEDAA